MKIGLMVGANDGPDETLDGIINLTQRAEALGFPSVWMAHISAHDAMMAVALAGKATSKIQLGTAVVATYPRHPVAMAQQALTTHAACSGRFTLGIGVAHKIVVEAFWGLSYDKPAKHMREYLQVLNPLLAGEPVSHKGELYKVRTQLEVKDAPKPVPLCLAALGPVMLKLAGTMSDGTITWVTGPKTIEDHIKPSIEAAAAEVGKPKPRIIAGLPIVLTDKPEEARDIIGKQLNVYGQLPSYRAMLDREGVEGPEDVALVGDAAALDDGLARLKEAGVTDFNAAIVSTDDGAFDRTMEFLASRL